VYGHQAGGKIPSSPSSGSYVGFFIVASTHLLYLEVLENTIRHQERNCQNYGFTRNNLNERKKGKDN
ncbi:unnamed protein product, partial [marine sediment metagenome]